MNDVRKDIQRRLLLIGSDAKDLHFRKLNNPQESKEYIVESDLLTFDYSKQRINQEILDYLLQIPDLLNLKGSLSSLFKGKIKNPSE